MYIYTAIHLYINCLHIYMHMYNCLGLSKIYELGLSDRIFVKKNQSIHLCLRIKNITEWEQNVSLSKWVCGCMNYIE